MSREDLVVRWLVTLAAIPWAACSAARDDRATSTDAGPDGTGGIRIDATTPPDVEHCKPGGPNDDVDGDHFTPAEGDCDDCDANRNPNAIEVIVETPDVVAKDENCDGEIDEAELESCDADLHIDEESAYSAAHGLDFCKVSRGEGDWGLIRASWVLADGVPAPESRPTFHVGHGILRKFGAIIRPRRGTHMTALSSGTARAPEDPGYENPVGFAKEYTGNHPPGFPNEAPACPGITTGQPHDVIGLELEMRVPSNATGFSFDFDFYTYEWPDFFCSEFNDFFVALVDPPPGGQPNANISFDKQGNPIGVNSAFVEVCGCSGNPPSPCLVSGRSFECPRGNLELVGTGFDAANGLDDDHAATGWLRTTAPVWPGSTITLRLAIYDSGDGQLDSTVLLDNFQWLARPGVEVSTSNPVK